jgi:hypothetical protein
MPAPPQEVLYAAPGDANYQYGPSIERINGRLAALGANANSATINVTFDNSFATWPSNAMSAFQAAVNIWQQIVTSSVPINVKADFDSQNFSSNQLGSAGPTFVCSATGGVANALYAAALANATNGNTSCSDSSGFEIVAHFNNSFASWDFGSTPVSGKYSFMSVVLHELGHGLGFYGSMQSANGIGSHYYDTNGAPGAIDIWDKFIDIGGAGGSSILGIASPSAALHAELVGNNLFFSGTNTNANNSGAAGKIESHNFTTQYGISSDNGFLQGSSYSHLDDVLYSPPTGTIPTANQYPNGLMTWQIAAAEVYTDPGPIMRGIFADEGWKINSGAGACTFSIAPTAATVGSAASDGSVSLTASSSTCAWTATSGDTSIATITSAGSGTGSATITYHVALNSSFNQRSVNLFIGGETFAITQNGTGPTMTLDRTLLVFGGVNTGASFSFVTSPQTVRMTQAGPGTITWTATASQPWIQVSPSSGTGTTALTISTVWAPGFTSRQSGTVTVTLTGAGNSLGPITVTLNSIQSGTSQPPYGSFDTPASGTSGIAGSIPVTGWSLDDVQVMRVTICRDAVSGESPSLDPNCAGNAKIYIGDAVFVDGARTDVQAANPTVPLNSRAGWGYLMLTNFLPNLGNGTFTLEAYAFDAEGNKTLLGSKLITCANASSTAPFGAIDQPAQGAVVSGSAFANFGWVLAQGGRTDPPGGGTVQVFVDGTAVGVPSGWTNRSDLTTLFVPNSSYPGLNTALGVYGLNTTVLANGVHTIFWIATGAGGIGTSGIGSRFITVSNGSDAAGPSSSAAAQRTSTVIPAAQSVEMPASALAHVGSLDVAVAGAPADLSAVPGRRGYDLDTALQTYTPSAGHLDVQAEELDRIELHLSRTSNHQYTGYLHTPAGLRPLPVGSTLNASTGAFTWTPGVGFYGTYDLTFVRWSSGHAIARQDVRITLNAKGSNRIGPQTVIDVPGDGGRHGATIVGSPFYLGGWAADLDSSVDSGVSTVHVWAYPIDASGARLDPIFLGPANYGGARPDVAAVYGARFGDSGYGLIVSTLPPGTYDLAVFAYSTVLNNFTPAKVVRIVVR